MGVTGAIFWRGGNRFRNFLVTRLRGWLSSQSLHLLDAANGHSQQALCSGWGGGQQPLGAVGRAAPLLGASPFPPRGSRVVAVTPGHPGGQPGAHGASLSPSVQTMKF